MRDPSLLPRAFTFQPVWSSRLDGPVSGLLWPREHGSILAWDQNHWLYLLDERGERQGQVHFAEQITAVCCADDGSACAVADKRGVISWLAPDLTTRWQHTLSQPAHALAMDPFGQYLAAADAGGTVRFFNRLGQRTGRMSTPRPLHHLAFVPAAPAVAGCADYGLVLCFDLDGKVLWRDGLVAHAGALAVNGDGSRILVACFSEGVQGYNLTGVKEPRWQLAESCRLLALSYTGRFVLTAGLKNTLALFDQAGLPVGKHALESPIAGIALNALGNAAVIGTADGKVRGFRLNAG